MLLSTLNDASPRLTGNLIMDSPSAAIWASPGSSPILDGNRLQGNGINGLAVWAGQIETDQTWSALDESGESLARVLAGEVTVAKGATLQIQSGAIVKADTEGKLIINGGLRVLGEENQPVVFTSLNDDSEGGDTNQKLQEARAGDWLGFDIKPEAEVSFGYAVIRYAQTGLILRDNVVPSISGWLQVADGQIALWCDGEAEMPVGFLAEGNEDNNKQCPTQ